MRAPQGRQRGVVFLLVMLMMIPLCVMVGLVIDVGWAYFTTESARAAAEAAATAAVQYAMDSVAAHGGTYTCGTNGVVCQAATACAATVPNPVTTNSQSGCAYASANGYINTGRQTVTIQADIPANTAPPVSGVTVQYWVTARVTQVNPLTFLAVLGGSSLNVGVRSTAAVIPTVSTTCIVVLDATANQALNISGSATIDANNCAVKVASSSASAINVSGSASLTASLVDVVGGSSGNIHPTPITVPSVSNPYASLPAPTGFTTTCDAAHTNYHLNGGSATLNYGTYCGGINNSGGALTFNPGTYILYGGGFTQSGGSASSTGAGVTFYNTCSPSPCAGGQSGYGTFVISGGGASTLSAPTSGSLSGILFFQDPTVRVGQNDNVSGGSTTCFTGVLYFPESKFTYSGGSSGGSCSTQIVADTLTFSGASNLGSTTAGNTGPSAPVASLIE